MCDSYGCKSGECVGQLLAIRTIQLRKAGKDQCDWQVLEKVLVDARGDEKRVVAVSIGNFKAGGLLAVF